MHGSTRGTLQCNANVFHHSEIGKRGRNLERPNNALTRNLRWLALGDVLAIEQNLTAGGNVKFGQQIENSGFASAIGADQGMDLASLDTEVNATDGNKALELFHKFMGFQNEIICHVAWHRILENTHSKMAVASTTLIVRDGALKKGYGYPESPPQNVKRWAINLKPCRHRRELTGPSFRLTLQNPNKRPIPQFLKGLELDPRALLLKLP